MTQKDEEVISHHEESIDVKCGDGDIVDELDTEEREEEEEDSAAAAPVVVEFEEEGQQTTDAVANGGGGDDNTDDATKLKPNPLDHWVGKMTFFTFDWMTPMILKGIFKPVPMEDIWDMRRGSKSSVLLARMMRAWNKRRHSKYALIRALMAVFGWRMFVSGIFKLLLDSFQLAGPLLLSFIIENITDTTQEAWVGYVLVGGLFISQAGMVVCSNMFQYHAYVLRVHLRSVLMAMVYDKSMRLSIDARNSRTVGEIVNYMSLDSQKIADTAQFFHMLWTGFYQIAVCLIVLLVLIGWPALVGMAVMLATIPLQLIITKSMAHFRIKSMVYTDRRIKSINEILQGIRIIKFFGWERSYMKRINDDRRKEVLEHAKMATSRSFMISVMLGSPTIVSVSTFATYVLVGFDLKAEFVFSSLAYFNLLRFPLMFMSNVFQFVLESIVSLKRLENFFRSEEYIPMKPGTNHDIPVLIEEGQFEWSTERAPEPGNKKKNKRSKKQQQQQQQQQEDELQKQKTEVGKLQDINISIPRGSLTMIVGAIGSGKSSLLSALIGEMRHLGGKLELTGSIAYCPQQAWLQTATLRDNILFGSAFDHTKYEEVIHSCELAKDLTILPNGDETEIGEKGLNLSGGQKQRVSIARAVYADADIYLLDDVLSALDQHVGRAVFENCIRKKLEGKTRLLVSHQLQYTRYADKVLVMESGRIVESGSYEDLMSKEDGIFRKLITEHVNTDHEEEEEDEEALDSTPQEEGTLVESVETDNHKSVSQEMEQEQEVQKLTIEEQKKLQDERTKRGKLITQEDRAKGNISLYVYWRYVVYMGGPLLLLLSELFFIVAQLGTTAGDWWMSMWTSNTFPNLNIGQNLIIYASLGVFGAFFMFVRTVAFYTLGLIATYRMHNRMLRRIMHATMSFFDTTPVGRILNRFSKDCEMVDTMVPIFLVQVIGITHQLIVSCGIILYATWYFVFPLIPVLFLYWLIQHLYRRTSRELKRHEAVKRSPVFSHFSESINGIDLIRAFDKSQEFIEENRLRVDTNMRPFYAQLISMRWLGVRLEALGVLLVSSAALFTLFSRGSSNIQPGVIGLALAYSLQLTQFMQFLVTQLTEAETAMNSVERMVEYADGKVVTQETIRSPSYIHKPDNWPSQGGISFKGYVMRYRPDLDPVLRGLTFDVKPGEHVGIVGRTGAGKSSIMLALYRMMEASDGSIEIDGINISSLKIEDLRTSLSIIPQDPTLFSGTVRSNLDPFNEYNDRQIWECLDAAHMKEAVLKLELGLDAPVAEGGENFSVGQRQLFCLARALIRKSKILILDEATANVDLETDSVIQQTIRDQFAHCTTLTIAHRLNTIIDSDRILVLDHGRVEEYDSPANLVLKQDSIFNSLIAETGPANARALRNLALESSKDDEADNNEDSVVRLQSTEGPPLTGSTNHDNSVDASDASDSHLDSRGDEANV